MSTNLIFMLATLIIAGGALLGFLSSRHGPEWLQSVRHTMKRGTSRVWFLLTHGIGWALWLALTVLWAVNMLQEGEPLIVVAFIAPLFALLMGVALLLAAAVTFGLLLGWFLLGTSLLATLRVRLTGR